jgi:hypothetical protein
MSLSVPRVRELLKNFELAKLFVEELGWDRLTTTLPIAVNGQEISLRGLAQKRGVQIYECPSDAHGRIPAYDLRRKIEKEVVKSAFEHLIIFVDKAKTTQIWQWVARQAGQPAAFREHTYSPGRQSGDALIQKLSAITIPLSEEEAIDLTGAVHKLRDAFDRDRVTKRFYDHFKREHAAFLDFIKGITEQGDREWYASLMLNRLMFIYFIQRKGFLDADEHYLRNRLRTVQESRGRGRFQTFYRYFLLCLFHEGFSKQPGKRDVPADMVALLGEVPYLNGGLFDVHELERTYEKIDVPDEAFEKIFAFFDQYEWYLDARPLHNDREINPDVLGYIFEKYINQKQMGAYYTKEDITEYISKNTVVPYLFDAARKKCAVAFQAGSALWRQLKDNPDQYIYPAVRHGVDIPLPPNVIEGIHDIAKRRGWNALAAPDYALPTETWREHVARRQRCLNLRQRLAAGEIHEVNELITNNLDIRQFASDTIAGSEGPELVRAFWQAIREVTVLDPTCGSGAFLFAALNILEPLYEACLDRMQAFVEDLDRSGKVHSSKKFEDFRKVLADMARHPNRTYFIFKSIVVNNLYGVDIMEEAVEICKLRLFLKLVAQVETVKDLEPLPDIDFNIRPGNTLVGFAKLEDVQKALAGRIDFDNDLESIKEEAEIVDRAFHKFHEMQTVYGMDAGDFAVTKLDLRKRLDKLGDELDQLLASDYGVDPKNTKKFEQWRQSHLPFHWCAEFYGIMANGGFDVIVGNPPYVEYSKVRKDYQIRGYQTESSGNLYAMCIERSYAILSKGSRFGFIVQAPLVSTQRMSPARSVLHSQSSSLFFSTYDDRPSKLFDGMHHCRLAIVLSQKAQSASIVNLNTTRYYKWYREERPQLFQILDYTRIASASSSGIVPKFRSAMESAVYSKLLSQPRRLGELLLDAPTRNQIFYKITGVGHWFSFTLTSPKFWRNGQEETSTRENTANFQTKLLRDTAYCCLCSSLHYWLYQARTNCRDFNPSDLAFMPLPQIVANGISEFGPLADRIAKRLIETSSIGEGNYAVGGSVSFQKFRPKAAKDLYDEADRVLAEANCMTADELDFIINYDIKYRMGQEDAEDDE